MPIKLGSREYKIIGIFVLVTAVSLAIALKYFTRAFPEATLDLRVDRGQAASLAKTFLTGRNLSVSGSQHAEIFNYDDESKLYLERTQGLARLNQLTAGPVHLWRWSNRWFRPLQKEEFQVEVTPKGEVVGFAHEIAENAPGPDLPQPAARALAEQFLTAAMKRDLGNLDFVEGESDKRPHRTDHTFTWKQKDVNLGDGSLRVEVRVAGDQVSGYREFVKVPEQWTRDYERVRSRNDSAQIVDEVFWFLLSAAMLILLIMRLRDHDVPLRFAVLFAAVAAVLSFLSSMNEFSQSKFGYPTENTYSSFFASYLMQSTLSALGAGAFIFLLVAAAEPAYREGFPALISLRRYFSWNGLRTRSFFIANVVGIGLTFFFFAYQTVFYLAANRLGAWAPSDVPFTNDLNTAIPWAAVLFGGFFPAVSEEIQFRAFAIPFLRKYVRYLPLAIVLAAFNWGFLHAAYPNQPFYIRGVEVGVGGVIIGFLMVRFGVVATMIWHYSVDALYTAFLLLRSPNHYLAISGGLTAGIMLIPLMVTLVVYLKTGTFTDEAPLTNAAEGVSREPAAEEVERAPIHYQPLSPARLWAAGIVTVVAIGLALIPSYRFGQEVKVGTTRAQAIQVANGYLNNRQHVAAASYRQAAFLRENVDVRAVRYLLEHTTVRQTDKIYQSSTRPALWEIRYFRPLQKEEYHVYVDVEGGQVFGFEHLIPDEAPGASLPPDQAEKLAESALVENGYQPAHFELVEHAAQHRKAREDYVFVWQAHKGDPRNVGDALYRVQVVLAGDQLVRVSRFIKLPETWIRERQSTGLANVLLLVVGIAVGVILVAEGLLLLVKGVRAGSIPWRQAAKVGAVVAVLMLAVQANRLPSIESQYRTEIPFSTFQLFMVASVVVVALLAGLGSWLLVGLAASLYPEVWHIFSAPARRLWRRDAAVAIVVTLAAGAALSNLRTLLAGKLHAFAPVSLGIVSDSFDTWLPAFDPWLRALAYAVFVGSLAAILIRIVRAGWQTRPWWFWSGGLCLLVSLGPWRAHSLPEYLAGWAIQALPLLALALLIFYFLRDNALAYLGVVFTLRVADLAAAFFAAKPPFFHWNGVVLVVISALVLGWMLLPRGPAAETQV